MRIRSFLGGIAATAVTASVLTLTGTAAFAEATDPQPDDTSTAVPTAAQLLGAGSDTTQHAVKLVSDAYNATNPSASIFTYAACATPTTCGQVTLPDGTKITRPNGSGGGKRLLYGANNNVQIDFARSSSPLNDTEIAGQLQAFPYALDTLVMVTSKSVASNAPASLTPAQIVDIYEGDITNWSQLGGTPGVIKPYIPQTNSGTRDFFTAQLAVANNGVPVSLAGSVTPTQEHNPADIQNDPNAIAPFSEGRANLAGTVRVEGGFAANRAVYNVVRQADVAKPEFTAAFGSNGYFCSAAAKPLIEQAGFKQLFRPTQGGVCGAATQAQTTNFTVAQVATKTGVTVTSVAPSSARIVATVTGSTAPSGTVAFYEGSTLLASGVPLSSGQAVRVQPTTPGTHTYRAVFTPAANTAFTTSEGTGAGVVSATATKVASSISAKFPKKAKAGKKVKGTVTVTLAGSSAKASGVVTVTLGKKTVGKGTLSNGVAKVTLKKLKPGKNKLTITWAGDNNGNASTAKATIKVVKVVKKK
ncbi:PstS family phosphate ABC transporter substrate-binding protein [Nocardioides flavescens]|uniref:Ig-like domain (Group 3) n=1 Tax=Nocardioides flavescens TaxID=2691959 RepID=A0A6L7F3E0_9ACTN|nr:substrate-binding domain-containing protein [Nocardioides flavescens]MXG91747.1 hypothetical protein [Nocardioides flavescens]